MPRKMLEAALKNADPLTIFAGMRRSQKPQQETSIRTCTTSCARLPAHEAEVLHADRAVAVDADKVPGQRPEQGPERPEDKAADRLEDNAAHRTGRRGMRSP